MEAIAIDQKKKETCQNALHKGFYAFCKCGCGRSLDGFRKNRQFHPYCDSRAREIRREAYMKNKFDRRREAFFKFNSDNPHVYLKIVELARKAKKAGKKNYGIKAIIEVIRWEEEVETEGKQFKLDNNYSSFYARLIMEWEKDLKGFFKTRENGFA